MSSNLYWRPVLDGDELPDPLKFALEKRSPEFPQTYGFKDHDYLCGLRDAGVKGAEELLGLIHTHGEIELYLEY